MTSLKRRLCVERHVDAILRHKDVPTVQHVKQTNNWLYTTIYLSFVMLSASFLVLHHAYPFMDSSGSRNDNIKTDFDFKMSERINVVFRWVKTVPKILPHRCEIAEVFVRDPSSRLLLHTCTLRAILLRYVHSLRPRYD